MPERQAAVRELSDEELIKAFQEGSASAFDEIVRRYKDQLVNYVFRYLGDYDEADDVAQETFVRVYHKKDLYRPVAKFSTWIYTIATNLAKTQLHRRKRHLLFSLSRRSESDERMNFEIPDVSQPTDGRADSALKQEIIQKALDSIPEKYRQVVILCDIQELTYEEICDITGVNIGTVKSRLNRGRLRLQELLKDLIDE